MSQRTETIKLEAMYYHMREPKHIEFLQTRESYAWFRTINTFKGGKVIIDTDSVKNKKHFFDGDRNRGRTVVTQQKEANV